MTNLEMVIAAEGISRVSTGVLPSELAFRTFMTKKSFVDAKSKYIDNFNQLPAEVGIVDTVAFDAEIDALKTSKNPTEEQKNRLTEMESQLNKLNELRTKLAEEECKIDLKPMSYEQWNKLCSLTSKDGKTPFGVVSYMDSGVQKFIDVEMLLENILWLHPQSQV